MKVDVNPGPGVSGSLVEDWLQKVNPVTLFAGSGSLVLRLKLRKTTMQG